MSSRTRTPTQKGSPPAPGLDDQKTSIFESGKHPKVAPVGQQTTGQIQVISMKTPGVVQAPRVPATHKMPEVKLRSMAEVASVERSQSQNLGFLAPPRDPADVRARRVRDYVVWGCVSLIFASAVTLAIWFLAASS